MKKKQISKKEEEDFSDSDKDDQSNSEENSEGDQEDNSHSEEEEKYGSDEEEDEILGVEPNEAMLAWADLFKDESKLTELSAKIWDQENPDKKEKLPIDDANQARIALNKELLKYVKEKQPIVEDEDPQKFPIEKFGFFLNEMDKAGFVEKAHDLKKMVEILEILGSKLMPAIYSVYEEKYKEKESTWGRAKVYLEFFKDVEEKMNVGEDIFDSLDEAMQVCEQKKGKTKFDFDTCIRIAKSNFEDLHSQTSLYRDSNLILKYTN